MEISRLYGLLRNETLRYNIVHESGNHCGRIGTAYAGSRGHQFPFLTEELNKLGIEVLRKTIVGDNRELLAEAFRDALNRVPVVIASGGLGPTEDDLTRETVAELLGRKLQRNDEVVRAIEARFRSFKRDMPAVNLRQAMVPEGAEVLDNPRGTAPGLVAGR